MKPLVHRSTAWMAAAALVAAAALAIACESETGPDAPRRTNGCNDLECAGSSGTSGSSGDNGSDAGGFPSDPLAGTSRAATLVRGGFRFTEGPVWSAGRLLFTDTRANQIRELLPDGGTSQFRSGTNGGNGLAVDRNGNLILCESGMGRVTRSAATRVRAG